MAPSPSSPPPIVDAKPRRAAKPRRPRGWLNGLAIGVLVGLAAPWVDKLWRTRAAAPAASPALAAARNPMQIRPVDWLTIARRAGVAATRDGILLVAAGVTFYALLGLFPAIAAFVSLYGLFADVGGAEHQIVGLHGLLPGGAISVIGAEMQRLQSAPHGRLGASFAVSLLVSLWSASAGMKALINGLNVAYERREQRGFFSLTLVALVFTLAGTALAVMGIASVVTAPALLARVGLGGYGLLSVLRWPALLIVTFLALAVVYRYGPCRPRARWRWVTAGSLFAGLAWLGVSLLFSWYVSNFGHYDRTYGSLGAVVGFMTWIWISLTVVLLGAELNAETERQTGHDETPTRGV